MIGTAPRPNQFCNKRHHNRRVGDGHEPVAHGGKLHHSANIARLGRAQGQQLANGLSKLVGSDAAASGCHSPQGGMVHPAQRRVPFGREFPGSNSAHCQCDVVSFQKLKQPGAQPNV